MRLRVRREGAAVRAIRQCVVGACLQMTADGGVVVVWDYATLFACGVNCQDTLSNRGAVAVLPIAFGKIT